MAGAIPSASRSAVVERLAPLAMRAATMSATAANQRPTSHRDLTAMFNVISTLLWVGAVVLAMRPAPGTDPAPAPARRAGRQRVAETRSDQRRPTRVSLPTARGCDSSRNG